MEENSMKDVPPVAVSGWQNKLVKCVSVVVIFTLTTAAVILSKGSTLFLVSQVPFYNQSRPICSTTNDTCPKHSISQDKDDASAAWSWCLVCALLFPDVLALLSSGFTVFTRHVQTPPFKHILVPVFFQGVHSIGICILFFIALPGMSSVKMALITTSVCSLPAFFKACSDRNNANRSRNIVAKGLDAVSIMVQLISVLMWTLMAEHHPQRWSIPAGLFLTSFGWWESYLPYNNAKILSPFFLFLRNVRDKTLHEKQNHVVNIVVALWKITITFVFLLTATAVFKPESGVGDLFDASKFGLTFENSLKTTFEPGRPPAIAMNETIATCGKSIPIISTPDPTDCSGFWIRICLDKSPSLTYVLCPEDKKFAFNTSSRSCYGQGVCCKAKELVDCAGRVSYDQCLNPAGYSNFSYPQDSSVFEHWSITLSSEMSSFSPFIALLIQITTTFIAFQLSKYACQTRIEILGFALPMTIAPLATVALLAAMCHNHDGDACFYQSTFPANIFFNCSDTESFAEFVEKNWIFILTFMSQVWTASHIWHYQAQKLAMSELIFDAPFYDSLLIEQSLLLNRRKDDELKETEEVLIDTLKKQTKVIGCATMWHETVEEMSDLLKSVFTMDKDSHDRAPSDEDYYNWEMHIFFDDAIQTDPINGTTTVNKYVMQLITLMDQYQVGREDMRSPTKSDTPYGGKLIWTLPQGTTVTCHLKDKALIRHKKRWSQCMYILYFLGHPELANLRYSNKTNQSNRANNTAARYTHALKNNILGHHLRKNSEEINEHFGILDIMDNNTFLLALDGDVIFTPDSIVKLVDLMKKDDRIGAACGRIHPTGNGLIAMYQKFEYAVGHWLQKSTEHVLGNVLCSPGCFSLFRCKALMENLTLGDSPSAMDAYATVSSEPIHYIQYDQGEDRWLCTLLIQRGWKVEYCAVSDSFTACPDTFDEFYNQRRRWTPSTVANLLEILRNCRPLLKHGNLSVFHVIYQILMLTGAAVGPGSIFILLVGGLQMTFSITLSTSFFINAVPIILYILLSAFCDSKQQIVFAKVLSLIYGLCMIAVMFGLVIKAFGRCMWAPSTFSLELTVGAFLLVGLLHPLEITDLFYGVIYYLTIPCMYLLLPIYCVFNLDDVSWGTREIASNKSSEIKSYSDIISNIFSPKKEIVKLEKSIKEELSSIKDAIVNLKQPNNEGTENLSVDSTDAAKYGTWIQLIDATYVETDEKEALFWEEAINRFLKPLATNPAKEAEIKNGLQALRMEAFLLFLFVNSAWAFGIYLCELSAEKSTAYTIDWPLCESSVQLNTTSPASPDLEYISLDPINLVFMLFFLMVLFIQVLGMLFHRIKTIGHINASTSILNNSKRRPKVMDQYSMEDISLVDGRPVIGIDNPIANTQEPAQERDSNNHTPKD